MIAGRLPGIDGLRAVAALWVVLFHVQAFSHAHLPVPGADLFLRSGSTGVSLFLVISGFCLFLPFAGGRAGRFRTGDFFLRRARRLLPAYYVSLVLAAALYLVGAGWLGFPHLSAGETLWQLLTHATLTHPLFPSSFYTLNGAYWSLGLEWQLYLALPLLILGVRRFGLLRTASAAILCNLIYRMLLAEATRRGLINPTGVLATVILPNQLPGRWAEFVFGMIAADLYARGRLAAWAGSWAIRALAIGAIVILIPLGLVSTHNPLSHLLFGGVFLVLISVVVASDNPVSRLFSWRPLVSLGVMSYSLYLVHQPLIQAVAFVSTTRAGLSPLGTFAVLIGILPLIGVVAFLLFITVERRTLTARRPLTRRPVSTVPDPALASAAS